MMRKKGNIFSKKKKQINIIELYSKIIFDKYFTYDSSINILKK